MTTLVFLGSLIGGMAIGMPVAFALLFCGVILMAHMGIFNTQIVAANLVDGANSFTLLAIPFFLLAGELMNAGGLSRRIVDFATAFVGHIRGGLGLVAILAAVLLASMSGSASADSAALAAILIPMMKKAGYNVPRSAGLVATGGIIAPVVPPSIALIIFGVAANVSISQLFIAAVVPGLLMAVALVVTWQIVERRDKVKPMPRVAWPERMRVLARSLWALMMPVIILGGIRFGIFTPTEAAVVAAVYALFVGAFVYREITFSKLYEALLRSAKTTSVVMLLVAAALVSAWLITAANIPAQILPLLEPFMDNQILLMVALMAVVFLIGTALDLTPTILILTPVLMPIVIAAGINPVYFGVLFILNNAIGLLTPPVGVVLNVVSGVARVPLGAVIIGVWPFLLSQVVVLALLIIFPDIVMVPFKFLRGY